MIVEIVCSVTSNNADGQIKLSTADIPRAVQDICSFEVGSTPQTVPPGPLDSSTDSPDGEVNGIVIFFITNLFLISFLCFLARHKSSSITVHRRESPWTSWFSNKQQGWRRTPVLLLEVDLLNEEGKNNKREENIQAVEDYRARRPPGEEFWSWVAAQPQPEVAPHYCYLEAVRLYFRRKNEKQKIQRFNQKRVEKIFIAWRNRSSHL